MHAFRFSTPVLIGPWRATREQAQRDAVAARQAIRNPSRPDGLEWRVTGQIEQSAAARAARRAR